jgi:hypothetical protein
VRRFSYDLGIHIGQATIAGIHPALGLSALLPTKKPLPAARAFPSGQPHLLHSFQGHQPAAAFCDL